MDRLDQLLDLQLLEPGNWGVGAHTSGVRPFVAVEGTLVVLSRREGQRPPAVADGEQRELGAFQQLLDDNASTDGAERHAGTFELGLRTADVYPLARGQPVGLEHAWRAGDGELRR